MVVAERYLSERDLDGCPLEAPQVHRILESARRGRPWTLSFTDHQAEQLFLDSAGEDLTPDGGAREGLFEICTPVVVGGQVVGVLRGEAPLDDQVALTRTLKGTAARVSEAWLAAREIDSLASEIIHTYEELHLLYELGETLTRRATVAEAADYILEKVLSSLRATWVELRLVGRSAPQFIVVGEAPSPGIARMIDDDHVLGTTLYGAAGDLMGTIVIGRPRHDPSFSSPDRKLFEAAGTFTASALRSAQLNEELRNSEAHLRAVMDNVVEGIITADDRGLIRSFNTAAECIFGYGANQAVGRHFSMLTDDSISLELERSGETTQEDTTDALVTRETVGKRQDGSTFPMEFVANRMRQGGQRLAIVTVHDITERKQGEAALEHQALYDALTDLPNRTLLHDRLEQAIRAARRDEGSLALLVMDLDRFKEVNDTFGHHYGDLLLVQVARRFREVLRETDTIARLGGDEFAVVLPGSDTAGAAAVAVNLLQAVEHPFAVEAHSLDVGASLGIAVFPEHGVDAETLLRRADISMYAAKRAHSGYAVYASEHDHNSAGRLALISDLKAALECGQLELYYQPNVEIHTGRVIRVEALARWNHPKLGLLLPDQFIPLAEQTGLIAPLSWWALEAALSQCGEWRKHGLDLGVAVNVSAQTLHDPTLPSTLSDILHSYDLDPDVLRLEITESTLMADPPHAMEVLTRLRRMGVSISIDDFGTGYSSLAYLKRLPVDEIKIDRSFVNQLITDEDDAAIVRSTIRLAHDLRLTVVAEGVEDQATWDLLAALGCDIIQGYFLSPPVPASELTRWLDESPWTVLNERIVEAVPA